MRLILFRQRYIFRKHYKQETLERNQAVQGQSYNFYIWEIQVQKQQGKQILLTYLEADLSFWRLVFYFQIW